MFASASIELIFAATLIFVIGLEPWCYYIACKLRKRTWQLCRVRKITKLNLQPLIPFYAFNQQRMLVEYEFQSERQSSILAFDKALLCALELESAYVYVDPKKPQRAFLYRFPEKWSAYYLPCISLILLVLALH